MTFFPALGYLIIPTHPYCTLPYPIPSYQIPSLPHPTRILNTILHLYKILLPYTTLSYHIEIEPNRPTAETSRIGTPSKFCNPVLPYPIPSYQIPSLPHPTRILNTILHLYKILLPYTTLSYHIEIEPNRPTAETSRIGTPSKFTRNDPNSVVCTAKMLKSFGLVYSPILRLKNVFFGANLRENRKQSTLH